MPGLLRNGGLYIAAASIVPVTLGDVQHSGAMGSSSWSFATHDLAEEDDLILILWNVWGGSNGIVSPTSVTYGGVAATPLTTYGIDSASAGQDFSAGCSYILNADLPAVGADKTCALGWAVLRRGSACVVACRGALQAAPQHNGTGVEGVTSIGPTAVTVSEGGATFQSFIKDDDDVASQGGSETLIASIPETVGPNDCLFSRLANQSGSVGMSASWSTNETAAHIVVGVNPA